MSLLAVTSTPHAQSQSPTITAAQKNFPEFLELLRIPNVAAEPADMQRNTAFSSSSFASTASTLNYSTTPHTAHSCSPRSASRAKPRAPSSSTSISMASR